MTADEEMPGVTHFPDTDCKSVNSTFGAQAQSSWVAPRSPVHFPEDRPQT